jgi:adenylate kinase family enzyme
LTSARASSPPAKHPACGQRVVIVGSTGSGKSTLASVIGARRGIPHIELDGLHWEANWTEATDEVFRARVAEAVAGDSWVVDGNYHHVRDLIWPRADTIIWLDYAFHIVAWRLWWRTLHRVFTREPLWNGNRERLWVQFFHRDSLFLWFLRSYGRRKRETPLILARPENAHLSVIHLHTPAETAHWLTTVE